MLSLSVWWQPSKVKQVAMAFKIVPDWVSTPNTLTLSTVLILLVAWVATLWIKRRKFVIRVNKVPGSYGGYTLLGDASDVYKLIDYLF